MPIKFLYKISKRNFGTGSGLRYPKPKTGFVWLHITEPSKAEIARIRSDFKLADTIFEKFSREKRSVRYTFNPLSFTLVDYYIKNGKIAVEDILFIVGEHYLITITKTPLEHYHEFFGLIAERLQGYSLNVGYLLADLLDYDAEGDFDILQLSESRISEFEKTVLIPGNVEKKITNIVGYKRYLLQVWRRLWSNSKIIFSIKKGLTPLKVDENLVRLFDHIHDTFVYQMDIVTTQRETLTDALTIYEAVLANKLAMISNKINNGIKKLTLIMFLWTAIAVILSIPNTIATILGIPEWPISVDMWEFIALVLIGATIIPIVWFYLYWKKFKID